MNKELNESTRSKMSRKRYAILGLITIVLSTGIGLFGAEMVLDYQRQYVAQSDNLDEGMMMYDPSFGWRIRPNWSGSHRQYDFAATYHINQYGFRGGLTEPRGGKRFAVVGDSFTFGQGVNDDQTFSYLLEKTTAGRSAFLNFGVLGFSTDQQYLLIKDRVGLFNPHVVLLVAYLGNDLFDNERSYPLQGEHGKPFFQLRNGKLYLQNSPVPRQLKPAATRRKSLSTVVLGDEAGRHSAWDSSLGRLEIFRRLGFFQTKRKIPDSVFRMRFEHAIDLFVAIIGNMNTVVDQQGAILKLVLLPGQSYVTKPDSISAQYQDYFRLRIVDSLADIQVFDLAAIMREEYAEGSGQWYFPNEGHLTALGHRCVADLLANWLDIR